VAGNRLGRGNPHARRMAALRQAFLSAATEDRLRELGEKLLTAALAGDWQAAKLYLLYVVGRPAPAVDPDGLDKAEWQLRQEGPETLGELFGAGRRVGFAEALRIVESLTPEVRPLSLGGTNTDN